MIAIIVQALWTLGSKALKSKALLAVGVAALALYFLGIHEITLLFSGGLIFLLLSSIPHFRKADAAVLLPLSGITLLQSPVAFSTATLFLTFLKIGSVLYGSGYVQLGLSSLMDPFTLVLAVISAILLFVYKINSTWLIAGGALAGLFLSLLR